MDEIDRIIDQRLRDYDQLGPADRAKMLGAILHQLGVLTRRVSMGRGHALIELRQSGKSAIEIAGILGVSRQQVHRLLREAVGEKYVAEDN